MQVVNIHQAKSTLSQLIEKTLNGEEIIIAKAGKPIIKLSIFNKQVTPRKPGSFKNRIFITDDFDSESEEINKMFYDE